MPKKFKQFMSALVLATLVLSLTGQVVKAATASSRNYEFYFDYTTGDPYDYSGDQPKNNTSYSLVNYKSGYQYSYTAAIVGLDNSGLREDITLDMVRIYPGTSNNVVHNWVRENGLSDAVLRGESDYDIIYESQGTWNADAY